MGRGFAIRATSWLWLGIAPGMLGAAQQPTFIRLEPLRAWQLVSARPLSLQQAERWDSIPAVDREYGVEKAELDAYEHNGITMDALIEKAADPSAAYGLFTFYQTASMRPERKIDLAAGNSRAALMTRGVNFVRLLVPAGSKASETDIRSLLVQLGGSKPAAETSAWLPPSLPSEGLLAGSQKYLLGPQAAQRALPSLQTQWLGFNAGAEVESAEYVRHGVQLTFLIISYPTPQLARLHFKTLENKLGVNHAPTWRGKRTGAFVFLVQSSPARPALAESLMNQMQVKQWVTWDQKLPRGRPIDLQVVDLIMSNVALVLILAGLAVATGVLMVILRRLLPRWFPRSEWAQQGDAWFIQLNLR